jgi:hypothetical protein
MSFDFLTAIKNIAPFIAGTFGTPLAGLAVKAICATLPDNLAKSVNDAHAADPVSGGLAKISEMFAQGVISTAQIKQAEATHTERMVELGYKSAADLAKIAADDRADARGKAVEGGTAKMLFWLSLVLLVVCIGAEIAVLFHGYPDKVPEIVVGRVLGLLDALTMLVASFWYGTTVNNGRKDDTIAAMAKSA